METVESVTADSMSETVHRLRRSWPPKEDLILLTAGLAWATGVVHAIASAEHFGHYWLFGAFFALVALLQLAWGAAVYHRASRRLLLSGVVGSLAIALLWTVTRTLGLPVGPETWEAEPIGAPDLAATLAECLTAALAGILAVGSSSNHLLAVARGAPIAYVLAYPLLVATVFAAFLGGHHH